MSILRLKCFINLILFVGRILVYQTQPATFCVIQMVYTYTAPTIRKCLGALHFKMKGNMLPWVTEQIWVLCSFPCQMLQIK